MNGAKPEAKPSSDDSAAIACPAVRGLSQFALTLQATEVLLSVGQAMPVFDATGTPKGIRREFYNTLSLSPVTAKQLAQALAQVVHTYEERFGNIPEDPRMTQALVQASQPAPAKAAKKGTKATGGSK